ncbi:MAG: metallopeptidase family protein [Fibrobacterales bacterium]|nr:metallopeptidase family protein [Fibrobacterales bacterium]
MGGSCRKTPQKALEERLARRIDGIVKRIQNALPEDLRKLAEGVPVYCEWKMARHWVEEGLAPDSLGVFSGPSLADSTEFPSLESPSITFFLAELWDYSEEDLGIFDEEARITYLHEFGHYLGLEEGDMEERGLL